MNPRQAAFVREFLIDFNATQAAIRAGYSEKAAQQTGSRLVLNAVVAQAIKDEQAKLARRTNTTLDGLVADCIEVQELALQGTPAMDRYGKATGQVVRQLSAAKAAIELRAKLTGFLVERRENTKKSIDDMTEAELRAELAKGEEQVAKLIAANDHGNVVKLVAEVDE
jgi:phage terminase small subunit